MRFLALSFFALSMATTFSDPSLADPVRLLEDQPVGMISGAGIEHLTSIQAAASAPIARYKKQIQDAITHYSTTDCKQISTGAWSVDIQPKYGVISFGTITGTIKSCPGKTFTFAAIYYTWTAHNNKSKTDRFNATWRSGQFDVPGGYTITVPVVRPVGETSTFVGWADSRANWQQTLIPPPDDSKFDFSGELVRERHQAVQSTCNGRDIGDMGSTPNSTEAAPWSVGPGNVWGNDAVGWAPCAVAYYRCVKATPCGYAVRQQMLIKSPADDDYTEYTTNILGAWIDGFTLPFDTKPGFGGVSSIRGNGARQSKGWVSFGNSCPSDALLPC